MPVSSLRRIVLPEVTLAILTQAFSQVGFSVFDEFELIVLPGESQPIEYGLPPTTILSVFNPGSRLSVKSSATRLTVTNPY